MDGGGNVRSQREGLQSAVRNGRRMSMEEELLDWVQMSSALMLE